MGYWEDIFQTYKDMQHVSSKEDEPETADTQQKPTLYVFAYLDTTGAGQPDFEQLPPEERNVILEAQQQKLVAELSKLRKLNTELKKKLSSDQEEQTHA